jgi:hypothetical protein
VSLAGNLFKVVAIEPMTLLSWCCCHIFCGLWCGVSGFSFHDFYHYACSTAVACIQIKQSRMNTGVEGGGGKGKFLYPLGR